MVMIVYNWTEYATQQLAHKFKNYNYNKVNSTDLGMTYK